MLATPSLKATLLGPLDRVPLPARFWAGGWFLFFGTDLLDYLLIQRGELALPHASVLPLVAVAAVRTAYLLWAAARLLRSGHPSAAWSLLACQPAYYALFMLTDAIAWWYPLTRAILYPWASGFTLSEIRNQFTAMYLHVWFLVLAHSAFLGVVVSMLAHRSRRLRAKV